jgi:DNA polymerase kappa
MITKLFEYCQERQMSPDDVVAELRGEVLRRTGITVSAGIAPNTKIAKIASSRNKPNGQFRVANDRTAIMAFMRDLPVRKVNGIGRVFDRELEAVCIKTCGDIYHQRAYLAKLFGQKAFQFLMHCYLGIGRTIIRPAEEYERKSVGTESTFSDMSGKTELRGKLRWIAEELEKDLLRMQFKGRTLCLKVKLHTYEVLTRQAAPPKAVQLAEDLYQYALPMLSKLEQEIPGMKLRLMGLRVTHLVSTKKKGIDFFGAHRPAFVGNQSRGTKRKAVALERDGTEWEVWPEEEFEEVARQERQAETEELEALSQEQEQREANQRKARVGEAHPSPRGPEFRDETRFWNCPVCFRPQMADDREFNSHVDYCLSRQTIKEALKESESAHTKPLLDPRGLSLKGFSQLGNVKKNHKSST